MKKHTFIIITLIAIHFSNSSILTKAQNQLGNRPLASSIDSIAYIKKSKLKRTNPLEFQPDNAFGGPQASGLYDFTLKTATITTNDGIKYNFILVKELPNPNNNQSTQIGSFVAAITRGMPQIRYLYGQIVENK